MFHPHLIPVLGGLRVEFETRSGEPGSDLAGGQLWSLRENAVENRVDDFGFDPSNTVDDDPRSFHVDVTGAQQVNDPRLFGELFGQFDLSF